MDIIKGPYQESIKKLNLSEPMLLEDNDPKHKSKVATKAKEESKFQLVTNYPPQSPDLNPIENLWIIWDKAVHKRNPKNLEELRKFAHEEWKKLNERMPLLEELVNSMPRRLNALIEKNGWNTKY